MTKERPRSKARPPGTRGKTPPASGSSGQAKTSGAARQAAFFRRMGGPEQFRALFDHLPDVHFFAKDADGHHIAASSGVLQRLGFSREEEILGLTDEDIHPARVAMEIREDDRKVMTTRQPLLGRIEALFTRSHAKDWYVTTKLPIFDHCGEVIGIMGFVRPYQRQGVTTPGAERLERVVDYIHTNHSQPIAVDELARIAHLSARQLHRRFREVFGMSTQTFIIRTRVQAASDDLLLTDKPLSEIAAEHGFYDQSAFCRRFFEHTGETPLRFRQRRRLTAGPVSQAIPGPKQSAP